MNNGETPPNISTDNPLVNKFYDNTQSNIIRITDDKLKVILLENRESIEKKSNFLTPLILLITFGLTFCTSDFNDFINISKDVWQAFYLFCFLGSLVWLIIEWNKKKEVLTVEDLLNKIRTKNQSEDEPQEEIKPKEYGLEITKAIYWSANNRLDVTEELRQMIRKNTLRTSSNNDIKGDPEPGKVKILSIEYKINGHPLEKDFPEGDRVVLP